MDMGKGCMKIETLKLLLDAFGFAGTSGGNRIPNNGGIFKLRTDVKCNTCMYLRNEMANVRLRTRHKNLTQIKIYS
jgi:hypothetical protein